MALEGSARGPVYPPTQSIMDGSAYPWPRNHAKEIPTPDTKIDFKDIVKRHPHLIVYSQLALVDPKEFERIVTNLGIV